MLIGLYLRHIKVYKNIKYIPIWYEHNFVSYVWENWIGKSTILEALDSFFNWKKYIINYEALATQTFSNNPYILPIFLIKKDKITKNKSEFKILSDFFRSIQKKQLQPAAQWSMKEFFSLRDKIKDKKDDYYLILMWETNLNIWSPIPYIWPFEENLAIDLWDNREDFKKKTIKLLQEIKEIYSYIYFPVELDVESATKIETEEMQKLFNTNLKKNLESYLRNVNFNWSDWINTKLKTFLNEIEITMSWDYKYATWNKRWNNITKSDIAEKIIEAYFHKRTLYKWKKKEKKISAWEKRQALINLVYAFLMKDEEREKNVIIAIDEPENSLHTSLCYDQFEKLQKVSIDNQILITTHRYWFLPIISNGISHFLTNISWNEILFESYDLFDYKSRVAHDTEESHKEIPHNFALKSTTDLLHSIFYSLSKEEPYNWLIVEWLSEKIYFEYFFKNEILTKKLRILCLWWKRKVAELYDYLKLPIKKEQESLTWKVYLLIDTDSDRFREDIWDEWLRSLKIKRLSNKDSSEKTELLNLNNSNTSKCDIEQALNPIIFKETLEALNVADKYKITNIQNEHWNTSFEKNFRSFDIWDYFKEDNWDNKIKFARKYIEIMTSKDNPDQYIPQWINEIKQFYN